MESNKIGARLTANILKKKGVQYVVICPGSRNAPIIHAVTSDPYFSCFSIVDERSAAFFALGIAQFVQSTVAIVSTSGTATLNFAPAIAEAYYQRLPLLIITADRPLEWVNQGESQTLDQRNIFRNYVRASYDLIQEPSSKDDTWFFARELNEAINFTENPYFGPVHVNIRFREPLYDLASNPVPETISLSETKLVRDLPKSELERLMEVWKNAKRKMIVCGQFLPGNGLNDLLSKLTDQGIVVLTESTSNIYSPSFVGCIDKVMIPRYKKAQNELRPNLVVTIGGPLISRKIKQLLREDFKGKHWHVDPIDHYNDVFQCQSEAIKMDPKIFLQNFVSISKFDLNFIETWKNYSNTSDNLHNKFLSNAPYSDLKAFDSILESIPEEMNIQIGNSSAIRYMQLFDQLRNHPTFCNRGTSGIEGSVSTAVGFNTASESPTLLITGDLSMMYDSNGLWNQYLTPNLKIIVINNQGGGIFRIIDGPKNLPGFEKFIETTSNINFEALARMHGVKYQVAENESQLKNELNDFFKEDAAPVILEVRTPRKENDQVLKEYFESLKG